jgi:hypothetical protein
MGKSHLAYTSTLKLETARSSEMYIYGIICFILTDY